MVGREPWRFLSPFALALSSLVLCLLLLPSGEGIRGGVFESSSLLLKPDQELFEALGVAEASVSRNEEKETWRLEASKSSTWDAVSMDDEHEDHHPADEMLQTHNADGSQSYILSGY